MTLDQHHDLEVAALRQYIEELEQTNAALQLEIAECRETSRRTEEALHEREDLLKFVIKYNPNAIAVFDKNLHYMLVSDRYRQDYGLGDQAIIGRHHYDLFPEMPQKWRDVHQRCLDGAIEGSDDDWFLREDGSITYNRWDCRPWYDAHGNIGGLTIFTEVTTERKQAEEELRRAQFALDRSADGIHWLGPDGTHIYVNDAVTSRLGYTRDELLSMHVSNIDPNFPREQWDATWNMVRREKLFTFESQHRRKDGSTFPVEVVANFLEFNGREYICAVSRDISERKQAEEQQRRMTALVENSTDFIGISTLEGEALYLNEAGRAMVGIESDEELRQTVVFDYFPSEEVAYLQQEVVPIVMEQGRWSGELHFRHFKTDALMDVHFTLFLLKDPQTGQPMALGSVTRDITERKHAEQEMQKLVSIIENSTDFIGMVTFDGQPLYLNPAGKRMVGMESDEEFINTPMIEYVAPDEREHFLQHILPALQTEGRWKGEVGFYHFRNRTTIPAYYNAFLVRNMETGEPLALAATVRDISDMKQAEAERAALQQQVIEAQRDALRELSTPLMPIADGVLAMPLIGTIDSGRAQQVLETLLEGVATHQAQVAILDITGVQVIDTQVADALIRAARAVKLLGAQAVLTGIQPRIAQTLVHLGVDLSSIVTRSSLQSGIAYALKS